MFSSKSLSVGLVLAAHLAVSSSGCTSKEDINKDSLADEGLGGGSTSSSTAGSGGDGGSSSSSSAGSGGGGGSTSSSSAVSGSGSTSSSGSGSTSSSSTGSGGGSTSSGSDAGVVPANNVCPGAPYTLNPGDTVNINATTAGSTENYDSFCGDTSVSPAAPNVVYSFTLSQPGVLNLTLTAAVGSALVPALDIRTDCSLPSDFCISNGSNTAIFNEDLAAGTYYVIVTGQPGTSGAFTLSASLTVDSCGNGVVDPGEACDPGLSPPANDGCGAPGTPNQCQVIAAPVGEDTCPGQALAVSAGTTILAASAGMSTYGFTDNYYGSCAVAIGANPTPDGGVTSGESDGAGGLDRVFQITPDASGTLTVSIGYDIDGVTSLCAVSMFGPECWASVLYARETCDSGSTELACAVGASGLNFAPATISFAVTAGTPYSVFVDGYDNQNYSYGPFNLIVTLQ